MVTTTLTEPGAVPAREGDLAMTELSTTAAKLPASSKAREELQEQISKLAPMALNEFSGLAPIGVTSRKGRSSFWTFCAGAAISTRRCGRVPSIRF
jgi:hypothetical protein